MDENYWVKIMSTIGAEVHHWRGNMFGLKKENKVNVQTFDTLIVFKANECLVSDLTRVLLFVGKGVNDQQSERRGVAF